MSVQTSVFENGRWITRSIDPYHLRAKNRRHEGDESDARAAEAPPCGLLTQTLVRSSVIKQIIPARIRHKNQNDALFISADSVVIKQFSDNRAVEEIIVKNDFDSPIRTARVLGDWREHDSSHDFDLRPGYQERWMSMEGNENVKEADSESIIPSLENDIPPQILVLALESSRLVFLCSRNGTSHQPRLLWGQHPLPAAKAPNEQLGEHLAVDPK